jgi:hypothetical protein
VQLQACHTKDASEVKNLKEHIQLALSSLNQMGEVWPIARVVHEQLTQYSREVLSKPQPSAETPTWQPVPLETYPNLVINEEEWTRDLVTGPAGFYLDGLMFGDIEH